ncbi:MAG: 2-amino-4-hydroxy-6-hydroxymethyldihydropteridine diphosphokinase, partial [Acidimicrobiia bacterium]
MPRAAVALGSNVGDRLGYLRSGLAGLGRIATVVSLSALYETEPVGGPKQGAYLNAVALIETDFEAGALLERLQEIENRAGRIRGERWGPRTLDLDLIVYDQVTSDLPELSVPHPRADERRFVLEPLH